MNGPGKKDPKLEGAGKLVGGYAAGNLSEPEKRALFDAALHDQDVFDALMEEQALQDLLEEPGVKAELIEALAPKLSVVDRIKNFLATPLAWGSIGAAATAAVLLVVMVPRTTRDVSPSQTAQVRPEEAAKKDASPLPQPLQTPAVPQSSPRRDERATPLQRQQPRQEPSSTPPRENEKREQAAPLQEQQLQGLQQQARQQAPQQSPQQIPQQERDRLPPPPAVQQAQQAPTPLPVLIRPVPAASAGATGQLLTFDYALVRRAPDGSYQTATTVRASDAVRLQVMPGDNGYLTLSRRSAEGLQTVITGALPVTRGQVVQIPQQGSLVAGDGAYVLMLSRDSASSDAAKTLAAPAGAVASGYRQGANQTRARKAAEAAPGLLDLSLRKAVLPSVSLGRAAAETPESRVVAVEITIRPEN